MRLAAREDQADGVATAVEERRAARLTARVLRVGLALTVALFAVGLALQLADGRYDMRPIALAELGRHGPLGERVMGAGVLVVAATPAAAVAVLAALWVRQHDWRFAAVALVVLVVLVLAYLLGG